MTQVRFGIFTDLHVDIMHDCARRLRAFLDAARAADVDFIIQLGDFCYPDENRRCVCSPELQPVNIRNALAAPADTDKDAIRRMFREFERPAYSVIGNHDLDLCTHDEMLRFYGMDAPYYSFDCGGIHFVALDANYCFVDGKYVPYDNGVYFTWSDRKPAPLPYLPDHELAWLEQDLRAAQAPSVLFSHQMLRQGDLKNWQALHAILRAAPHPVILSANGHLHKDNVCRIGDTWFWNVNSMSNYWLGEAYETMRYDPQTDARFPNLRYVAPYRDPLYAIVTITDGVIDIRGPKSEFVGPAPAEMGFPMDSWEDIVSPSVTDYSLSWRRRAHP